MKLTCLGTGSSGNCYALTDNNGNILLLDAGIKINEIKIGVGFNVSKIIGAVVTHTHKDHSLSADKLKSMGIPTFTPYTGMQSMELKNGIPFAPSFTVKSFPLTDLNDHFVHTNGDGSECPCYGFLIEHEEMGRLVYITDTEFIKWRFNNIDHLLLGVNYADDFVQDNDKRNHVLTGHMSLKTATEFAEITSNRSDLKTVIMCHLSSSNAEPEHFINEMQKAVNSTVLVAKKGMEINLER